ncbi:MAG: hypothetical protein ABSB73_02795 [Solirubrobacteraceae bacterium]|jgi:hypothetical protein
MPFADFVKATVVLCAAAATTLAAITLLSARGAGEPGTATVAIIWWALACLIGLAMGRRAAASPPITRLLGGAKVVGVLPPQRPGRILLARLWPLLLSTLVAGALALLWPQIPAIATGFALIWALAWRQQNGAVIAIERRDGVRFYVEETSPLRPITLTRTPGFKAYLPTEERSPA